MNTRTAMPEAEIEGSAKVIPPYTYKEYFDLVRWFHNYPAPGVLIGGFMVAEAQRYIPEGTLYDAISETSWCLPDAIQMLTPCTTGNGWLRVLDLGVYALALYDKYTGKGVRVNLDTAKLEQWEHIAAWLYKSKPKQEQDSEALRRDIPLAGASICAVEHIELPQSFLRKRNKGSVVRCPICGDAYPGRYGRICRRCQGEAPYLSSQTITPLATERPRPVSVPVEESVGKALLHDMTQVKPGEAKGAAFIRGQTVSAGDVCRLQQMGRFHVYVEQDAPKGFVHEDDAAKSFGGAMSGPGTVPAGEPREGRVNLLAEHDGLFVVREDLLETFNLLPDVMAACRSHCSVVGKGRKVAATRAIPLYIESHLFEQAMSILSEAPLFEVRPLRKARAGVLITGNEVFQGLIEDKFENIITAKLAVYGCELAGAEIAPDDSSAIAAAVESLASKGCDLIITTAGLSVDPEDVTRQGLMEAGVADMRHGVPLLPGAMTLLARKDHIQVLGVPACALFYKTTSLDVILPRLLAGLEITRRDLAKLGSGGLCRECSVCIYPKCPFGK